MGLSGECVQGHWDPPSSVGQVGGELMKGQLGQREETAA